MGCNSSKVHRSIGDDESNATNGRETHETHEDVKEGEDARGNVLADDDANERLEHQRARTDDEGKRTLANEYEVMELVSTGGFSHVHRARCVKDGAVRAVKEILIQDEDDTARAENEEEEQEEEEKEEKQGGNQSECSTSSASEVELFARRSMRLCEVKEEYALARAAAHENVVTVYDFYHNPPYAYVVMELLEGEELLKTLNARGGYGEEDSRVLMRQILNALRSCHAKHVVHRDVKLENITFAKPEDMNSLRLIDFGLAKGLRHGCNRCIDQCGSSSYVAPEILLGKHYNAAADVWSAGVILYLLLCGELPFYVENEEDEQQLFIQICLRRIAPITCDASDEALDLIDRLLTVDPTKRLTAEEALLHPWFKGQGAGEAVSPDELGRFRLARYVSKQPSATFEERTFLQGDILCSQGERATEIYVIQSGACVTYVQDDDGNETCASRNYANECVGDRGMTLPVGVVTVDEGSNNAAQRNETPSFQFMKVARLMSTLVRAKNMWLCGRRLASVRALTKTVVKVIKTAHLHHILAQEYGCADELRALRSQQINY